MTTSEKNISNDKLKRVKDFLYTTLNSMTFGIFGTIVVGAIIGTLGTILVYIGLPSEYNVFARVSGILTALTGAGIGLSIALGLKVSGLKLVMITVAGGIATMLKIDFSLPGFYGDMNLSSPNPITAYFVVIITYFIIESIFKKKTNYDLFFIPIVGVLGAVLASYIVSWPIDRLMFLIGQMISFFIDIEPFTTSAFIGLIFGILLTLPFISSAGVAVAVFSVSYPLYPTQTVIAMAAAVVGCSAQMIGFAVQSARKNNAGTIFSIALASSMFQFKNIMKKPLVWVPTLITSLLLPPITYLIFGGYDWLIQTFAELSANGELASGHFVWPGMGSSGLVGQLQTLAISEFNVQSVLFVLVQVSFPAGLVFALDSLFLKLNLYKAEDLVLDATL